MFNKDSKDSVNITEDEFASIVQDNGFELQKITKVDQYISSPSDGLIGINGSLIKQL